MKNHTLLYKISGLVALLLVYVCGVSAQELSLDDCLARAAEGSIAQRNARLGILAAQAQREEARTLWFPTVKARALGFQALNPLLTIGLDDVLGHSDGAKMLRYYLETQGGLYGIPTTYMALTNGWTSALSVTQPLYAGGRIAMGNRLAQLGVDAAKMKANVAVRDDRLAVEQKYWLLVSLEDKQQLLAEGLALVDTILRDVRSAVDAGLALKSDVMQVQLRRDELVSDSLRLASGIRLATQDLLNAIAWEDGQQVKGAIGQQVSLTTRLEDLKEPEAYYVEEEGAALKSDEAQLLQMQVKAKQLERRIVLGEALPEIGVGASYGYGRMLGANPRSNGLVFASVTLPLSDWAKTRSKTRRIGFEMQQAENEQEYLGKQLVLRVRQAWEELNVCWQQLGVAERSVDTAKTLFGQLERSYDAGMTTMTELLQGELTLRQAQNTLNDRRIDYAEALSRYRALTR